MRLFVYILYGLGILFLIVANLVSSPEISSVEKMEEMELKTRVKKLENELDENPENLETLMELLESYAKIKDEKNFKIMLERMSLVLKGRMKRIVDEIGMDVRSPFLECVISGTKTNR